MTGIEVTIHGMITKRRMIQLLEALTPLASDKTDIDVVFSVGAKIFVINHQKEDTSK